MSALNQAITDRNKPKNLIHQSDRGAQYLSIRYMDKSSKTVVIISVGTTNNLYDHALAETATSLRTSEVIKYLKLRRSRKLPEYMNSGITICARSSDSLSAIAT
ncbi:hypothetical protein [Psychrobacter celer]|uniref:hypothetical protein n=1 Tax=Psychrobacter celer TaxID=306572 RepID=UPI003FD2EBB7